MNTTFDLTNSQDIARLYKTLISIGPIVNLSEQEFQDALLDRLGIQHAEDPFEASLDARGIVTTSDENSEMGEVV